jgi:6,7-dimethyl-8-ribityllumazine synthase
MPHVYEGTLIGTGLHIGIVVARFNYLVTRELLEGCLHALQQHGVAEEAIDVAWVPGSFELGTAAMVLARSRRYDAIVCLGCVIRGETSHYDHVTAGATSGIQQVGIQTGIPCIFGVLTTENQEQAFDRAGIKLGNKGADAAVAAIEMATLVRHWQ